ncbi:MAG: amidinotransferase [Bacteroidetes bacterium]|nr:MAG: amidinotransferase [Bacteroidota bacterium]
MPPTNCFIKNEWDTLNKVIVGTALSWGLNPTAESAVDPKSREHILSGTYPTWSNVQKELDSLVKLLENNGVQVLRPVVQDNLNQVFCRDVGVMIHDMFIRSSMITDRIPEWKGISNLCSELPTSNILVPPKEVRLEGGDIMPMDDEIWVGYSEEPDFSTFKTSRTNKAALVWLQEQFPKLKVRGFQLNKSDLDPRVNALHLDCCLCPLSGGNAFFHPGGLKLNKDIEWIREKFKDKICEIDAEAMYNMHCNLFSLNPNTIVIGEGFTEVHKQLNNWGYNVLETPFNETAKMEGLLRCVTLPLKRIS